MAKIIYKNGMEGQNKLSSIEGIEIDLMNGQKALIYPKYAEKPMLSLEQEKKWKAPNETEIEALKVTETTLETLNLLALDSPAAAWVSLFGSDKYGNFCLPSLLAAMEIQHQKAEIDALAETIEGADLLKNFDSYIWSCSRHSKYACWFFVGNYGYSYFSHLSTSLLVVPIILYR